MKESEMMRIAELTKRAVIDKEKHEKIRKDVARLRSEFPKVEYCFDK
jgi:glycine/serine hydroxymethyltransferase